MPKGKPSKYNRRFKIRTEAEVEAEIAHIKAQKAARNLVRDAIWRKVLPHPTLLKCVMCPAQAIQYHHPSGYIGAAALDVVPLCNDCHGKQHSDWPPTLPQRPDPK